MCKLCGEGFRFESTDLVTGRVKAVLHPISAEWEDGYSRPSTGSFLLATRDPSQDDVWCSTTGIYISQVLPDGTRLPRFGGFVEDFHGAGGGAVTLAFNSIDGFLDHRLLADDDGGLDLVNTPAGGLLVGKPNPATPTDPLTDEIILTGDNLDQTTFAKLLVDVAMLGPGEIPLSAVVDSPFGTDTAQVYRWWEFKNIGAALRSLVEAENGVKYWVEHVWNNGYWSSVIHFSDSIGSDRDYVLKSDREGWNYSLAVDAKDKASRVYGLGSGSEANTQFSVAYDLGATLPEYQATVAWKDQTVPATIDALTSGYVVDHRDPTAVPAMTIVGLPGIPDDPGFDPQVGFPAPEILLPGDTFGVELGYGVITVRDIRCRCLAVAWKLEDGTPVQRTVAMQPIVRPSDSIRTQTPAKAVTLEEPVENTDPAEGGTGTVTADPWPTPGLVTRIHSDQLHEISGTQVSWTNPGHIWVHNDNEAGDLGNIYLVSLVPPNKGKIAGRFRINPSLFVGASDFEAIRMNPLNSTLNIGDFGDNSETRNHGRLHIMTEPTGGGDKGVLPTTMIRLKYPFSGGWTNTESLAIHGDGTYYTLTKGEKTRLVSFGTNPTDNMTGTVVAVLDCTFAVDAVFTPTNGFLLVRTNHNEKTLVYDTTTWKRVGAIDTPPMPKSEGISVESSCSFLVTTEAEPHAPIGETETPVYRVLIPTKFGALCGTAEGPSGSGGGVPPPNPDAVPGQILDLSVWKLQEPI